MVLRTRLRETQRLTAEVCTRIGMHAPASIRSGSLSGTDCGTNLKFRIHAVRIARC